MTSHDRSSHGPLHALACALIAGTTWLAPQDTSAAALPDGYRHVVVERNVVGGRGPGADLIHDYGAFQLYALSGARYAELAAFAPGRMRVQDGQIGFHAAAYNPTSRGTAIPAELRADKYPGAAVRLVQFAGPVVPEWLDEVRAQGAKIVQYVPENAYLVLADQQGIDNLSRLVKDRAFLRHAETLDAYFKLDQVLAEQARKGFADQTRTITVSIVEHAANSAGKASVRGFATNSPMADWRDLRGIEALTLTVNEQDIPAIARLPDVIAIEQYVAPELMDEVQSQIIAGNLNPSRVGPTGPGYLDVLASWGFSTNEQDYPIVAVNDDGVGDGSTILGGGDRTLTRLGQNVVSRVVSAVNCTTDPAANGVGGHGHLNSNIVGGYDARTGFPFEDSNGYQRGEGINPFTRLANVKIFTNSGGFSITGSCGSSADLLGLIKVNQDIGAKISTNSWGANAGGAYNVNARAYDIGTRDADASESGSQQLLFTFSAGNAGSGANTIGSPGTAKNIVTVGASENPRPGDESGDWTDGCNIPPTGADNAMDVSTFSSRGPTDDNRFKPEVIAPGAHVYGTASPSPAYNGTGVCDQYRPGGQTIFAASSGTSHSTPAVAGLTSLIYRFLQTRYGIAEPSPALVKAFLVAHPTYLTGVSANDNLPSNSQGLGMPNMMAMFAPSREHVVIDQGTPFTAAGQTQTFTVTTVDPAQPARVTLVWTDAPGATSGNAFVNDLDLSVVKSGLLYRGNSFTGAFSNTSGTADTRNNSEAVFLPPASSDNLEITVTASGINADALVPGGSVNRQDFALVCSNCAINPTFTLSSTPATVEACVPNDATLNVNIGSVLGFADSVSLSTSGLPAGASSSFAPNAVTPPAAATLMIGTSGVVSSGDYPFSIAGQSNATTRTISSILSVDVAAASAPAPAIPVNGAVNTSNAPVLMWNPAAGAREYRVEIDDDPAFLSIERSATVSGTSYPVDPPLVNGTTYHWRVLAINHCGETASESFSFTPADVATCSVFTSTDVPKTIGTAINSTINSTLAVSGLTNNVSDIDVVGLRGNHSWNDDMDWDLFFPGAVTPLRLYGDVCSNTDNFHVTLDDSASSVVGSTCPPGNPAVAASVFRPQNPLAVFRNLPAASANGTWTLRGVDDATGDGGQLLGWGLRICTAPFVLDAVADTIDANEDSVLTIPAPGVLSNDVPSSGVGAVLVFAPLHGALTLNLNGSAVFDPEANFCGATSFVYRTTDGSQTDDATVTINIACVNDAPIAANDAYVANEDTPLAITTAAGVLSNDSDVDSASLTSTIVNDAIHGTVSLAPDGSFTYEPDADFCGSDHFTYQSNDGSLDSVSPATAEILVTCINDTPVVVDDVYAMVLNTVLTVPAPGVLANDFDVDNLVLSPIFPGSPTNGTVSLNTNGGFTYTPAPTFCGSDSFTYQLTDGTAFSTSGTVTINVACSIDIFSDGFEN